MQLQLQAQIECLQEAINRGASTLSPSATFRYLQVLPRTMETCPSSCGKNHSALSPALFTRLAIHLSRTSLASNRTRRGCSHLLLRPQPSALLSPRSQTDDKFRLPLPQEVLFLFCAPTRVSHSVPHIFPETRLFFSFSPDTRTDSRPDGVSDGLTALSAAKNHDEQAPNRAAVDDCAAAVQH